MTPSQADYYRDAAGMIAAEGVPIDSVIIAHSITTNAQNFNAAIWAAVRLGELVRA